jgi:hypothetical protein
MSQHMDALKKANDIRIARAKVKRDIHSCAITVMDVLKDPPESCQTMTVMELLTSQLRWGRTRTNKFLLSLKHYPYNVNVKDARKLFELTIRERKKMIAALEDKEKKHRNRKAPQVDQT